MLLPAGQTMLDCPDENQNLPDQYAVENDRFVVVVGHGETAFFASNGERSELDFPVAIFVRDGGLFLAGKFDRDLCPRRIETPNRYLRLPLQDHVMGKRRRQRQRLLGCTYRCH